VSPIRRLVYLLEACQPNHTVQIPHIEKSIEVWIFSLPHPKVQE